MKIKNKVHLIECEKCGNKQAQLIVQNQDDECWGLDADAKLTDGQDIEHPLEGQRLDCCGEGYCVACDHEGQWDVNVLFEDGTHMQGEEALAYWMEEDDAPEQVKPEPVKRTEHPAVNVKELPAYH